LAKERDELWVRAEADPDGLRKTIEAHAATIRGLKHEAAYARVAKALRVNDATRFADLVKLAAYQPEGEEPDETKIATAFTEALKGRPWLVDATPAGAGTTAAGAAGTATASHGGKPGPGADRGQSTSSESNSPPRERIPGRL
jgi:hypothetical protein